jgi:hypothetical protein
MSYNVYSVSLRSFLQKRQSAESHQAHCNVVLLFNYAQRLEDIYGIGGIKPRILKFALAGSE